MPPRPTPPLARCPQPVAAPRPARARVLGTALSVALAACGSREAPRPPTPPAPPTVVAPARPAAVRIEGRLRDLGALRAVLPPMLAAAAPTRAGELLAAGCALPAALQPRIADDARLVFAFARPSPDEALGGAVAARVRVDEGPAPLGADTPLVDDTERGVRWIGAAPAEGRLALALVGDAVVCAESAALARLLGPYVARTLLPRLTADDPAPRSPVHGVLLPGAVSEDLRRTLTAQLALATLSLRERAARDANSQPADSGSAAPASARPGALALAARDGLRPVIEALAGAGEGSFTVDTNGGQLVLRATVDAPQGSRFAAALASLPRVGRSTLAALPEGTALGAVFGAESSGAWSAGDALRAALDAVTGDALPGAEGAKVDAALASLGAARGPALVVAAGLREGSTFALLGGAGATAAPDAVRLQSALDSAVLRAALAQTLDCRAPAGASPAPRASDVSGAEVSTLRVCDGASTADSHSIPSRLTLARRASAWALYVSRTKQMAQATTLAAEAAATLARGVPARAADAAIAALPERFSVGLAVQPASLGALLAGLHAAAGTPVASAPTNDAALHLALDHDARGAHLTFVAPSAAIASFVGAFAGAPGAAR